MGQKQTIMRLPRGAREELEKRIVGSVPRRGSDANLDAFGNPESSPESGGPALFFALWN